MISLIIASNHDVLHVLTNSYLHLQVDTIIKTPKGKQVKESSNTLGQLKKVKILNENLKVQSNQYIMYKIYFMVILRCCLFFGLNQVFKEKKSARENFVCGACGQV